MHLTIKLFAGKPEYISTSCKDYCLLLFHFLLLRSYEHLAEGCSYFKSYLKYRSKVYGGSSGGELNAIQRENLA